MSLNLGELFVVLGLDSGPFSKGVGVAIELTNRLSDALGETAKHAIMAASDFNETGNVMQQAFGKGASAAETWSATTASAVGRTTQQMREFSSVSQAMLSSMLGSAEAAAPMSKALSQLAVDMGSFWNVADKDAFAALRSGIAGESEPLKRFGIVMNDASLNAYALAQGISVTTQQMTEAEKTTLRYHYILDQTKMVQGDAVRTSDSFANQLKALNAQFEESSRKLGQQLMPQAQMFVSIARDMMSAITQGDGLASAIMAIGSAMRTLAEMSIRAAQAMSLVAVIQFKSDGAAAMLRDLEKIRLAINGEGPAATGKNAQRQANLGGGMTGHYDASGKLIIDTTTSAGASWADSFGSASDGEGEDPEARDERIRANRERNGKRRRTWIGDTSWSSLEKSLDDWQNTPRDRGVTAPFNAASMSVAMLGQVSEKTAKQIEERARRDEEAEQRAARAKAKSQEEGMVGFLKSASRFDVAGMAGGATQAWTGSAAGGGLVSMIAGGIQSFFTAILDVVKQIGAQAMDVGKSFLPADQRMVSASGKAMAMGTLIGTTAAWPVAPLAAFGAGLFELSKQTKSYASYQAAMSRGVDKIVQALEPFWANMMPMAGMFLELAKGLGAIASSMTPGPGIINALLHGFQLLALGAANTMLGLTELRLGLIEAARGIAHALNFLPGVNINTSGMDSDYENALNAKRQAQEARDNLRNMSLDDLAREASAAAGAIGDLTASVTNIPSGFKVAAAEYAALGTNPQGAGIYATYAAAGDASGGSGGGGNVIIHGSVTVVANDYSEFKRAMIRDQFIRSGSTVDAESARSWSGRS